MCGNYDKELLFIYSENARAKLRDIAKTLKKSPQRLKYTLRNLEREGIVANPHCIFDYSYFGIILFRVYFKGGYISEKDKANIITQLNENPYVMSMYELSGEFDLAIEVGSPNPSRFNKEMKKIASLIPTLNNYKILLNLVTRVYPKVYLVENSFLADTSQEKVVGGDREIETFNENEMAIMKNLLAEPKIRLTKLAKKSGMNIKTAVSILKNLHHKKIIKGFKYILDTDRLGIQKFRFFLKLHNMSKERENEMIEYTHPDYWTTRQKK